jgi:hypothetical protein
MTAMQEVRRLEDGRPVFRVTPEEARAIFLARLMSGKFNKAPRSTKPRVNVRELVAALDRQGGAEAAGV